LARTLFPTSAISRGFQVEIVRTLHDDLRTGGKVVTLF
jgi:hypothetical protein